MDWQYTNDRTVQLQGSYPHASQAVLPACLLAVQLCSLPSSLKQRCPHPRGSRFGGATHTRLNVALPASVTPPLIILILVPGLGPALALLRSSVRQSCLAPAQAVRLAEDRSSAFFAASLSSDIAASFIAGRRSHDGILPRTCCRGATRQQV